MKKIIGRADAAPLGVPQTGLSRRDLLGFAAKGAVSVVTAKTYELTSQFSSTSR